MSNRLTCFDLKNIPTKATINISVNKVTYSNIAIALGWRQAYQQFGIAPKEYYYRLQIKEVMN